VRPLPRITRAIAAILAAAACALAPARAAVSCAAGAQVLDWDSGSVTWPTGSLSNSYTVGLDTIGIAFTGNTNRLLNIFSGQTPYKSVDLTGGLVPTQQNLLFVANFVNTSEQLTLTINAGTAGQGVAEIEFTLFDLDTDQATPPFQFQDQIVVTGTLGGVSVGAPTFTTSSANTASGNIATGLADSANNAGNGNLTIKFATPVDRIVIVYRPGPNSIADPAQQGMSLHDITFCPVNVDYGDAPAGYGAPAHRIVSGVALGSGAPDQETAQQFSAGANGDDLNGVDDENGVTIGALTQSLSGLVTAVVQGAGGFLQAWFDWNGDGDFADAGEQAATNLQDNGVGDTNPAAGTISFLATPPLTATTSQTYARFRWSTTSGLAASSGAAANGEVEDYAITISSYPPPASCPAGMQLIAQTGNAVSVVTGTGVVNASRALGALAAAGTSPPDPSSAEIDDTADTLVLDLGVLTPQFGSIILSSARDGGGQGNTARVTIELSADNVSYSTIGTYGASPATFVSTTQDVLERNSIIVPSGGARYIRLRTVDGDDIFIDGVQYSQACIAAASLTAIKSVAVHDPSGAGLFATPGRDMVYTITVMNSGSGQADADSVFIVDTLPTQVEFYNADFDGAGPVVGPVEFTQTGAGLTFASGADLRFSSAAAPPANFASCTYAAAAGYDPAVRHVCFNPKGAMLSGSPTPTFSVRFRTRIK